MTQKQVLNVSGLSVEFAGGLRAVRGVDFSVGPGEVLGLVGESGCGKSVTCLSLLGLLPSNARVTGGEASFLGQDLLALDEKGLNRVRGGRIAYVFQNSTAALNPVMTIGRQIVEVMTTHQRLDRDQAYDRAVELLRRVGVPRPEQRMRSFPHQFSGGMNQRVMIAMALACDPALVIADEPTTALDVTIQAQILDLLAELARERTTSIVLITHDLGIVAEMADRVVIMYAGRVAETGTVEEIFNTPRHPYTRGLLTSRPRIDRRERRLTTIEGTVPSLADMPPGCPFAPRCGNALPRCAAAPQFTWPTASHGYACWNPELAA